MIITYSYRIHINTSYSCCTYRNIDLLQSWFCVVCNCFEQRQSSNISHGVTGQLNKTHTHTHNFAFNIGDCKKFQSAFWWSNNIKYQCSGIRPLTLRTLSVSLVARPWQSRVTAWSSMRLLLRSRNSSVLFCFSAWPSGSASMRPKPFHDSWSCFRVEFTWGKKNVTNSCDRTQIIKVHTEGLCLSVLCLSPSVQHSKPLHHAYECDSSSDLGLQYLHWWLWERGNKI